MKLVNENEYGAYLGVKPEFLDEFNLLESNPNFDVYDSKDRNNRLITAKSSRLPDDNDFNTGRYGINYHRAKPEYEEAVRYEDGLTHTSDTRHLLNDMAFVASNKEEYNKKATVWDDFYSFIWGKRPLTIWATPHSGVIKRPPDYLFPWPKLETDAYVAGIAAVCALNNNSKPSQRTMVSIHSHNWLGAILNVGGFGIIDESKLAETAQKIESKYHDKVQFLATDCKNRFSYIAMRWLKYIIESKNTLNPDELATKSTCEQSVVSLIIKSLNLYGKKITKFTITEFDESIKSLNTTAQQVMSYNYIYSGKHISELIGLSERINKGQLDSAVQIECSKIYLERAPELISNIILDIRKYLFDR